MRNLSNSLFFALIAGMLMHGFNMEARESRIYESITVEYISPGQSPGSATEIPLYDSIHSANARISRYRNTLYQVVIHEIHRGSYTEINGEMEYLAEGSSCATLRICFAVRGELWTWYHGLNESVIMKPGTEIFDTVHVATALPPDGAFNNTDLKEGGYGDPVGRGTMSYYPLCAVRVDNKGVGLGVDMFLPVVYRLGSGTPEGNAC